MKHNKPLYRTVIQLQSYVTLQLPKESLTASVPQLVRPLQATSHVVHTYSAHAIERLLMVRGPQGVAV